MIDEVAYENLDLSTIRKLLIVQAVEKLMSTTPFDNLTVRQVCKQANISRQTFYRHFQDKYAIAPWFWDLLAERYLAQTGRSLSWYEGNLIMIRKQLEHKEFFTYFYNANNHEYSSFKKHSYRSRTASLRRTIVERHGDEALTDEINFQVEFFVDAETRVIERWVLRGMDTQPETLARYIEGCVPSKLFSLLDIEGEEAGVQA